MLREKQEIIDETVNRYTEAIMSLGRLNKSPMHPLLIGYKDYEILSSYFNGFSSVDCNIKNLKKKYGFKIL